MAQTIRDLLLETARPLRVPRRAWLAATHLLALTVGFLACLLWFGATFQVIGASVAGIRQTINDAHPPVKVTAGQAWRAIRPFNKQQDLAAKQRERP